MRATITQPAAGSGGEHQILRPLFRQAAREPCASLRHVLPLMDNGRAVESRAPRMRHGQRHRLRIKLVRRSRAAAGATLLPALLRPDLRPVFRATARELCASLRRALPLAQHGGREGEERPPRLRHGRLARVRVMASRRARARLSSRTATTTPIDTLHDSSGALGDIAAAVQAQAAAISAGLCAEYGARIEDAARHAPPHLVGGIIRALQAELSAALAAVARNAAAEIDGRQQTARRAQAWPQPDIGDDADDDATRPVALIDVTLFALAL